MDFLDIKNIMRENGVDPVKFARSLLEDDNACEGLILLASDVLGKISPHDIMIATNDEKLRLKKNCSCVLSIIFFTMD